MSVLLESRSFRPFKSSEEYLYAMKEDLAEWLNNLYPELHINVNNFLDRLDTGVALCKHANSVRKYAEEYVTRRQSQGKPSISMAGSILKLSPVRFLPGAKAGTFFARDNVSNFISWCRRGLGVYECLLFETDDLIMRKNEKHVILCLLEVARRGAKLGMPAPMLVQLEREIDREIAADKRELQRGLSGTQGYDFEDEEDSDMSDSEDCRQFGPLPQIVTNDLKSLDEMVRDLVERCRCPTQFPMIRVSEGKYRIGDTKVLIFVRVLRSHVMVRVGGGWDTLSHYLDKHDPCRCKTAHRAPVSAKVVGLRLGSPAMDIAGTQVHYDRSPPRTRRSSASSVGSNSGIVGGLMPNNTPTVNRNRSHSPSSRQIASLSPVPRSFTERDNSRTRSRSPTAHRNQAADSRRSVDRDNRSPTPNLGLSPSHRTTSRSRSPTPRATLSVNSRNNTPSRNRSRSPTPHRETVRSQNTSRKNHSRSSSPKDTINGRKESVNLEEAINDYLTELDAVSISTPVINADTTIIVKNDEEILPVSENKCPNFVEEIHSKYNDIVSAEPNIDHLSKVNISDLSEPKDEPSIDTTPCQKISDNFISHPQRSGIEEFGPVHSKSSNIPKIYESGVDTTSTVRVSDNFVNQYKISIPVKQSPSYSIENESGVDHTPSRRVSDNFEVSDLRGMNYNGKLNLTGSAKKFGSATGLETMGNNTDSGSEISDEGYRSLGLVASPPATATSKPAPKPKGSSTRVTRSTRSRSVGRNQEPSSPQHTPFQRNVPGNRSARYSSPNQPVPPRSSPACNTWNSSGGRTGKKQRPQISAETFCQQVADIMQQYAAMMPSPRKDSKPDSRITTKIPAPVQRT
uniref:GAR domain-containing protein n=1 Tax=Clastoptera arizonana TaxID=38151 RepID=A0A1B6DWV1_9HEMI